MNPITSYTPSPGAENAVFGSKIFNPEYLFGIGYTFFADMYYYLANHSFRGLISTLLVLFAIFFLSVMSYCAVRLFEIRKKEHHHLEHEIEEYAHHHAEMDRKKQERDGASKNERWMNVLTYIFSSNANDWKLAVIEADSMLEALMTDMGFKGETLGEKLKSATQETFRGLSSAWEVHTIRNRIAHEGSAFALSQHEAKRIIAIYENIFRQFGYI